MQYASNSNSSQKFFNYARLKKDVIREWHETNVAYKFNYNECVANSVDKNKRSLAIYTKNIKKSLNIISNGETDYENSLF